MAERFEQTITRVIYKLTAAEVTVALARAAEKAGAIPTTHPVKCRVYDDNRAELTYEFIEEQKAAPLRLTPITTCAGTGVQS